MRRITEILLLFTAGISFTAFTTAWVRILGNSFGFAGGLSTVWLALLLVLVAFPVARFVRRANKIADLFAFGTFGASFGIIVGRIGLHAMGLYATMIISIVVGTTVAIVLAWIWKANSIQEHGKAKSNISPAFVTILVGAASFFSFAFAKAYDVLTGFIAADNLAVRSFFVVVMLAGCGIGAIYSNRRFDSKETPVATATTALYVMACFMWITMIALARAAVENRIFQPKSLMIVALMLLPAALLFGYALALLLRWNGNKQGGKEPNNMRRFEVTLIAGAAGLLVASFIQIPILGTLRLIFYNGLLAFVLLIGARYFLATSKKATLLLAIPVLILIIPANKFSGNTVVPRILSVSRSLGQVLAVDNLPDEIVTVFDTGGEREISIDRVPYAGNGLAMKTAEGMAAHLGMMMKAEPKKVLVIGNGTGYGAKIASAYAPQSIEVIEPNRGVADSGMLYERIYRGIGSNDLIQLNVGNPTRTLKSQKGAFDVILLQPPPVALSGNGYYFSVPFYKTVSDALLDDGVVICRVPLSQLSEQGVKIALASFADVFPNSAVIYPHTALVQEVLLAAKKAEGKLFAFDRFQAALENPALKIQLADLDINDPLDLINFMILGPKGLKSFTNHVELNTLNRPRLDFDSPSPVPAAWKSNLRNLLSMQEDPMPYLDLGSKTFGQDQLKRHIAAGLVKQVIASSDLNPDVLGSKLSSAKKQSPGVAGAGRIEQILDEYASRIAQLHPSQTGDRVQLAGAQITVGNYEKALTLLEDELRANPDSVAALSSLGQLYLKMNQPEEAIETVKRLLRVSPDNMQAMRQMGVTYFSTGEYGEAVFWFTKVAEKSKPDTELLIQLGMALARNNSQEEAERAFRKAISQDPDYARGYVAYGTMLLHDNRTMEAIRQFEKAIELEPNNKIAYGNLGVIYLKQKLFPEARKMFMRVLELDPGDQIAKKMLASIPAF